MPAPEAERTRTLSDFADLLAGLGAGGFDFSVVGGLAVGAYGRLRGRSVLSRDLDIYADAENLDRMLEWIARHGGRVRKRPQPRSLPVAVAEWHGQEVNILTESSGLPRPADAIRASREFVLREHGGVRVLVADPFDLLRNKVRVGRDKDRPHIEVLCAFVEEEVVEAFRDEERPRDRIRPARQYLDALGTTTLPASVAARLVDLARLASDVRFLASVVPAREFFDAVLARAPSAAGDAELREDLERIAATREWAS